MLFRSFYTTRQGKRDCPLPLQPHPQNQPGPLGEGTTLKPDISLATKSGHFHLLRTGSNQLSKHDKRLLLLLGAEMLAILLVAANLLKRGRDEI